MARPAFVACGPEGHLDSTLQILPPLAERLKGVDLIAYNHFLSAAKALAGRICIHAPTAERDRSETGFDEETIHTGVGLSFPTREESQRNAAIRHLRSRVERPLGKIKTLFKCFKPYWPHPATRSVRTRRSTSPAVCITGASIICICSARNKSVGSPAAY